MLENCGTFKLLIKLGANGHLSWRIKKDMPKTERLIECNLPDKMSPCSLAAKFVLLALGLGFEG